MLAEKKTASTTTADAGWAALLHGRNLWLAMALSGGVAIHAVNLYLAATVLPSVVRDIGGIEFYSWNTTVYVVASIMGAAVAARLLARRGPRASYLLAAVGFAVATIICALATSMPMLLVGRTAQGLAGGMLVSLPYALVRIVFEEQLWPRAIALVSGMWGVSTLLGPALGGIFAEFGIWRAAFWSLLPVIAVFGAMAWRLLPSRRRQREATAALPWAQLVILALAALAASMASVGGTSLAIVWIIITAALLLGFSRTELRAHQTLLPHGSLRPRTPLGQSYAIIALLIMAVSCTEIFVPLFLQNLHGSSPLQAGYIASLMSIGWTMGSLGTSGFTGAARRRALVLSPALVLLATAALALLMPLPGTGAATRWLLSVVLVCNGLGVGIAFPHISTRVLSVAPSVEAELAASSIMTIQLCATAFGAATAGLIVNLAGQPLPDGTGLDAAAASRWLFALFTLAPATVLWMIWRHRHAL